MSHRSGDLAHPPAPEPSAEVGGAASMLASKPGFREEALPHLDSVYRFALRLCQGDSEQASDVLQETFLRAYRSWDSYTRGTNCRSWLFTIGRNVFLRLRERAGRRPEMPASRFDVDVEQLSALDAFKDVAGDPEQRFFASLVDREVLAAVDALPDEFRDAVILGDLHGLPYAEIAEIQGVPLGTVKSRLFRGRRLLQQALREYAVEMGYIDPAREEP